LIQNEPKDQEELKLNRLDGLRSVADGRCPTGLRQKFFGFFAFWELSEHSYVAKLAWVN